MLLELPDQCLLAVLQFCAADDQCSLFNAARAHSRLHTAAMSVLRSPTLNVTQQHQVDGLLLYLDKHGCHMDSLELNGNDQYPAFLFDLPSTLQLTSLQLSGLQVQLEPGDGDGTLGLLGSVAKMTALKHLRLNDCLVKDEEEPLLSEATQLPVSLESLSIRRLSTYEMWARTMSLDHVEFPTAMLQHLQQLTHLELAELYLGETSDTQLQPLQALTSLADLRISKLRAGWGVRVPASMLSATHHLTRLELTGNYSMDSTIVHLEPDVLAGQTMLQHLDLDSCSLCRTEAGARRTMLSHLQHMQHLTYLRLWSSLSGPYGDILPPAAAHAALTASSKLQHLDISYCELPAGVSQYMFLAGKQLLQLLDISHAFIALPSDNGHSVPELSHIVSCCPGLQSLKMKGVQCNAESLVPLQRLSRLYTLHLGDSDERSPKTGDGLEAVCQLTALRELELTIPRRNSAKPKEGLLMQLTQSQQLTMLTLYGPLDGTRQAVKLTCQAPTDEAIWRQVLRLHLSHNNATVAQHAAAALAAPMP